MPPLALISSRAMSNAFFQIWPYSAFGPVSGPLTPKKMSPLLLPAPACVQPVIVASTRVIRSVRADHRLIAVPSFDQAPTAHRSDAFEHTTRRRPATPE